MTFQDLLIFTQKQHETFKQQYELSEKYNPKEPYSYLGNLFASIDKDETKEIAWSGFKIAQIFQACFGEDRKNFSAPIESIQIKISLFCRVNVDVFKIGSSIYRSFVMGKIAQSNETLRDAANEHLSIEENISENNIYQADDFTAKSLGETLHYLIEDCLITQLDDEPDAMHAMHAFLKQLGLYDNVGSLLCSDGPDGYLNLFAPMRHYMEAVLNLPGVRQALRLAILQAHENEESEAGYLGIVLQNFLPGQRLMLLTHVVAEVLPEIIEDVDDLKALLYTLPPSLRSRFISNEALIPVYEKLCADPKNLPDLINTVCAAVHDFDEEDAATMLERLKNEHLGRFLTTAEEIRDQEDKDDCVKEFLTTKPILNGILEVMRNQEFHLLSGEISLYAIWHLPEISEVRALLFISKNRFMELIYISHLDAQVFLKKLSVESAADLITRIQSIHWSGFKLGFILRYVFEAESEVRSLSYEDFVTQYPCFAFIDPQIFEAAHQLIDSLSSGTTLPANARILYEQNPHSQIFTNADDFGDRYALFNAMDNLAVSAWPRLLSLPGMNDMLTIPDSDLDDIENILDCFLEDTLPTFLQLPDMLEKILKALKPADRWTLLSEHEAVSEAFIQRVSCEKADGLFGLLKDFAGTDAHKKSVLDATEKGYEILEGPAETRHTNTTLHFFYPSPAKKPFAEELRGMVRAQHH